ncbi:LytTR family DNA-binding domain-containing protein [Nioella aestuarii]|uniref:LytTR family DNA-binding domain-containing protein n=1 Tax=Nioella aestuarii TaxID=1662864 RepID=UPI003D7F2804
MNDSPLQSAKRELHALLADRRVLVGVGAAGIIAGIAGPFGTAEHLRLLPRILYWLLLCFGTYLTGATLIGPINHALTRRGFLRALAALIAATVAGLVVAAEVAVLNWAVFDLPPTELRYLRDLALNGIVISATITVATLMLDQTSAEAENQTPTAISVPLLDRLPLDKRGPLISLSVQDHYVEVTTVAGREMLLMRLSDAIRETTPVAGLQVHRSHWVALGQVRAARRDGARAVLTMSDGRDIPVSRSNIAAIREAGLLPG